MVWLDATSSAEFREANRDMLVGFDSDTVSQKDRQGIYQTVRALKLLKARLEVWPA